jgi:hypothetical protein
MVSLRARSPRALLADPSGEEMAAIVAAIEMTWPQAAVAAVPVEPEPPRWRFAGRWWTKPLPLRRERPW